MRIETAITDGVRHLTGEFSVSRQEWRDHFKGGDDLLDGLVSHGYAVTDGQRFAVSEVGRRRLAAVEAPPTEDEA